MRSRLAGSHIVTLGPAALEVVVDTLWGDLEVPEVDQATVEAAVRQVRAMPVAGLEQSNLKTAIGSRGAAPSSTWRSCPDHDDSNSEACAVPELATGTSRTTLPSRHGDSDASGVR